MQNNASSRLSAPVRLLCICTPWPEKATRTTSPLRHLASISRSAARTLADVGPIGGALLAARDGQDADVVEAAGLARQQVGEALHVVLGEAQRRESGLVFVLVDADQQRVALPARGLRGDLLGGEQDDQQAQADSAGQ